MIYEGKENLYLIFRYRIKKRFQVKEFDNYAVEAVKGENRLHFSITVYFGSIHLCCYETYNGKIKVRDDMLTKCRWWPFLRPLGPFKSFAKTHKTKYSHIWSKSISVMCCWCLDFSVVVVDATTKGKQVIWTKAFHDLVQYFFVRNPVLSGTIIHSREMRQYNRMRFYLKGLCVHILQ